MTRITVGALFTALVIHAAILLFGGLVLFHGQEKKATIEDVEIVDTSAADAKKKDDEKDKKQEAEEKKADATPMDESREAPPDLRELSSLEAPVAGPALEALSLSDLEGVLGTESSDGAFAQAFSLASGGRIGASGLAASEEFDPVLSAGELDQRPRALFQSAPSYPVQLREKKIEGNVSIAFVVGVDGRVQDPRVVASSDPAFEKPALDAVRQWRFEAGTKDGKKVPFKMKVPITFKSA